MFQTLIRSLVLTQIVNTFFTETYAVLYEEENKLFRTIDDRLVK